MSANQNLKEKVEKDIKLDTTHDLEEAVATFDQGTKFVWCNFCLCELHDIRLTTKTDFHAQVQSDRRFDSEKLEEL